MPDAPAPTYDENGNMLLEWLVVMRYDPARSVITLSWSRDGDLWRKSQHGAMAYPADEISDALEGMATTVWSLSPASLF